MRRWTGSSLAPSHYLNQWWLIVTDWTIDNKFQWNLNRNSTIFIHENSFENVVCQNDDHYVQGDGLINKRQTFHYISPNCIRHSWWVNVMRRRSITPWRNIWQLAIVANRFGIYRTSMTWNDRTKYKSAVVIVTSKTDIGKFRGE